MQKMVMTALFLSKLEYCNAMFLGIDKYQTSKLKSLQNAAVRLILKLPRGHPMSQGRRVLHWLPVQQRVEFKALCLVYKARYGGGSDDCQDRFRLYTPLMKPMFGQPGPDMYPKVSMGQMGWQICLVVLRIYGISYW